MEKSERVKLPRCLPLTVSLVLKQQLAEAGDIVMVAGFQIFILVKTFVKNSDQEPMPAIKIDEPTIALNFLVNDSPFAGKEGKFVTGRQIRDRLEKNLKSTLDFVLTLIQTSISRLRSWRTSHRCFV